MYHRSSRPIAGIFYFLLGLVVILVIAVTPTSHPIKSLAETQLIYSQLNLSLEGGLPVLVFMTQPCTSCQELENDLTRHAVSYYVVDIANNPKAELINANLGRNIFGLVVTHSIPTIIVGTQVIRGDDIDAIMTALKDVELNPR